MTFRSETVAALQPSKWSLGILNPSDGRDVPGTVQLLPSLSKDASNTGPQQSASSTEKANDAPTPNPKDVGNNIAQAQKLSKDGSIILSPQPDDSPNDPLNWPAWRRNLCLLSVGFFSMLGGGITPLIAAGFTDVSAEFDVAVERVALTIGFTMMGLGVGAVLVSPLAIMFGKRPVYLITSIIVGITCVWAAVAPNFGALLAARVFQGVAASSVECLPSASIAEIFFLHERANRLGIYTLMLLGGRNLVPLVSAAVIGSLGWRWVFWIMAMAVALAAVLIFFLVPETYWDRTGAKNKGQDTVKDSPGNSDTEAGRASVKEKHGVDDSASLDPRLSFTQELKVFRGRLSNDQWHRITTRPFVLFMYPAILWSAIVYAFSIGWLIVISETVAIIYRSESGYDFTALQTGLVYLSPFIGGVAGSFIAGKASDAVVKAMARRNGGIYEPEFRLVMVVPVLVSMVAGLIGYGWSAGEKVHWAAPTVFFGAISFGCSLGSTTAINFALDSYRAYAGEALVTMNFSKNIFHGLVFSLFVTKWMAADGSKDVFIWVGVIHVIVLMSTVPMYIFGKRARAWTARVNPMGKL